MELKASFRVLGPGERPGFRSERVAAFHDYWLGLGRDGGLPPRAALDPADMRPLLPYVMIIDLEGEADFRVRYRLVGTAVAKFSGLDFTGHYLDQLDFDVCTTEDLYKAYREIRAACAPGLGIAFATLEENQVMDVEYLICPLAPEAPGDLIRQCVAIEDYMPSAGFDPHRIKLGRKTF
ncbi:PAS domain-containing protein [Dongia sp.]|uniref:PAS domain-containing protein n=1 Tax=Dongia sp. TaxID=1977262 RepID=UPI0035AE6257